MKKINHIVISGNIGVGKTTLSEKISKKFNWELQLEEVKDNPYLDDFYKSMKDWSFHLQIFFLNSRFNQIQKISESNNVVIQDRSIYEDYEVFTKTLFDSGVLMEREFNNYKRLYNTILKYINEPDLLIYLRNLNIDKIISNIDKRSRNFERSIDKEYLKKLNFKYLNHDYFTDVITFNYSKEKLLFGDIYISTDRVKENSKTYNTYFNQELFRVIIHGVLHLCGFNDKSTKEKQKMRKLENFFLEKLKTLNTLKIN